MLREGPRHALHAETWQLAQSGETELSLVARQCLGTRRIGALPDLQAETRAWNARANRTKIPICWRFTRKDARHKFGLERISRNNST
jgi:hypothetical protein